MKPIRIGLSMLAAAGAITVYRPSVPGAQPGYAWKPQRRTQRDSAAAFAAAQEKRERRQSRNLHIALAGGIELA